MPAAKFLRLSQDMYQLVNDDSTADSLPTGRQYTLIERQGVVYIKEIDTSLVEDKLYGVKAETHIRDFVRYYGAVKERRCAGVMFEGPKGTGKSATALNAARRAANTHHIPLFQINDPDVIPRLLPFLRQFSSQCVIYVDEFDKFVDRYESKREQQSYVNTLLSLMDGSGLCGVAFIFTVNENKEYLQYLKGRPGRIRFWHSYDKLDQSIISDYVKQHLVDQSLAPGLLNMMRHLTLPSIDVLSSLVDEANSTGRNATAMIKYMNIGDIASPEYTVTYWQNGRKLMMDEEKPVSVSCKLFERKVHQQMFSLAFNRVTMEFEAFSADNNTLWTEAGFVNLGIPTVNRNDVIVASTSALVSLALIARATNRILADAMFDEDVDYAPTHVQDAMSVNERLAVISRRTLGRWEPHPTKQAQQDFEGDKINVATGFKVVDGPGPDELYSPQPLRLPTPPASHAALNTGAYNTAKTRGETRKRVEERVIVPPVPGEAAEKLATKWVQDTLAAHAGTLQLTIPKKAKKYPRDTWQKLPFIPLMVVIGFRLEDKIDEDPHTGEIRYSTNYPDIIAVATPTVAKPVEYVFD